jgi:uncharacterized protein YndB with AHSA1/START domain
VGRTLGGPLVPRDAPTFRFFNMQPNGCISVRPELICNQEVAYQLSDLNQIQRSTIIRAPRSRVWRAITDISEFGKWFSTESAEPAFRAGADVKLRTIHPGPYYGKEFIVHIEEIVPEQRFSWSWHPGAPDEDVSAEPTTRVTFTLEDAEGGTRVTVTETGFDQLFEHRRARVLEQNTGGWKTQMAALERYFNETA